MVSTLAPVRCANAAKFTSNPRRVPIACSSGPLIQLTTEPSYLPGPRKLVEYWRHVGHEQVVALQHAERVQQRQRVGEAGGGAVAHVHARIAARDRDRPQQLAADAWRDVVRVEGFQRRVALVQPQRLPQLPPEGDGVADVGKPSGRRVGQQLGSETDQAGDQIGQIVGPDAEAGGDALRFGARQHGTRLHLVQVAFDARDLVGRQVVVDVRDVDEEGLVAQEAKRFGRPHRVEHEAAGVLAVLGNGLASQLEHVRRVVAHQVVQSAVVLAAHLVVEAAKLVQPDARLVAVADAQLEHVQLFGQRPSLGQRVPRREQLLDQLARGGDVARVALTAWQRLLVVAAGGLLPQRQGLPVQRVEAPDQTAAARPPRLERQVARFRRSLERAFDLRGEVIAVGAAKIDCQLCRRRWPRRRSRAPHGSPMARRCGAETASRKFCLYWIQSHTTRRCARLDRALASAYQRRSTGPAPDRRPSGRATAHPGYGAR